MSSLAMREKGEELSAGLEVGTGCIKVLFMREVIRDGRFILRGSQLGCERVAEIIGYSLSSEEVSQLELEGWPNLIRMGMEDFCDQRDISIPFYYRDAFRWRDTCETAYELMVAVILDGRFVISGEALGAAETGRRLGLNVLDEVAEEVDAEWQLLRASAVKRMADEHARFVAALETSELYAREILPPHADVGYGIVAIVVIAGAIGLTIGAQVVIDTVSGYYDPNKDTVPNLVRDRSEGYRQKI